MIIGLALLGVALYFGVNPADGYFFFILSPRRL